MALCCTPVPVHPCLPRSRRVLRRAHRPRCVSPAGLSDLPGIISSSALEELAAVFGVHPRCCWPPLPQGCIACSGSAWCLPAAPGPSSHAPPSRLAPCALWGTAWSSTGHCRSLRWLPSAHFSSLVMSLWTPAQPFKIATVPSRSVSPANLQRVLHPVIHAFNGDVSLCWAQCPSLGYTTNNWTSCHWSQPSEPSSSADFQFPLFNLLHQFLYEDIMANSAKSPPKVKISNHHCPPAASNLIAKGY